MFHITHSLLIIVAISLVVLNDLLGILWLVGIKKQFSACFLKVEHRLISVAFLVVVATGLAAAVARPAVFQMTAFWMKMGLVVLIGLNGYFMGKKATTLANQRFWALPRCTKLITLGSAFVSLLLWVTTLFFGWAIG
jgi:hypothetical protein